ncbi:collagen alpha-1(I) chain-like, partial [Homarus americanus]|uniref:collagen alpha-1(I) chain-like n=1 Tax=Homarus americanus TaxID=6706 RepID=UPI001C449970
GLHRSTVTPGVLLEHSAPRGPLKQWGPRILQGGLRAQVQPKDSGDPRGPVGAVAPARALLGAVATTGDLPGWWSFERPCQGQWGPRGSGAPREPPRAVTPRALAGAGIGSPSGSPLRTGASRGFPGAVAPGDLLVAVAPREPSRVVAPPGPLLRGNGASRGYQGGGTPSGSPGAVGPEDLPGQRAPRSPQDSSVPSSGGAPRSPGGGGAPQGPCRGGGPTGTF